MEARRLGLDRIILHQVCPVHRLEERTILAHDLVNLIGVG
jgi:hypothetical protein